MNYVTSKDGTRIAYEVFGSGPALILVTGGLCDRHTGSCGIPLAKLLGDHYTVYAYDRRGRGDSGNTQPYAVEREIEDIAALISVAGGKAALYGMSSGAILAFKATASGLPVTKLVMYEPPFSTDPGDIALKHTYETKLVQYLDTERYGEAVKLFMNFVGMPKALIFLISHSPFWLKAKALAPSLRYDARVIGDRMLPKRDQIVQLPVAVVDGGKSPDSMLRATKALADMLPNTTHITLPRQTHNVNPKKLAPAIIEFIG